MQLKYENLKVERDGHVAVVTFMRPEKANALNRDIMLEIEAVADEFLEDAETRVVVFTGEGEHFSSGADLTDPKAAEAAGLTFLARRNRAHLGQRMIAKLQGMNQITMAAMSGAAMGGGACIAAALDFRIGSEDCFVCYQEINLGMNLPWYGLPMCVRLVGPSRAKRLVILGNKEDARTLLEWGYLDEVVGNGKLMERALEAARQYAAQPPIPAQMLKRGVNAISAAFDHAVMHMDTDQSLLVSTSHDQKEAIAAWFEEREGQYAGE